MLLDFVYQMCRHKPALLQLRLQQPALEDESGPDSSVEDSDGIDFQELTRELRHVNDIEEVSYWNFGEDFDKQFGWQRGEVVAIL